MKNSPENIGIIILAAGASNRLGKPKQLLQFEGETLLKRAVRTALASRCRSVIVVLGAQAENPKREIAEFDVEIVENPNWENGMGTSIQIGLKSLLMIHPDVSGVILTVCDQPFVSANLISQIVESFQTTNAPIVACSYEDTIGVPALFSRQFFPEFMALKADNGAKKIIFEHREKVIEIPFEAGAIDIDTEQDYLNAKKLKIENGKWKIQE